SGNHENFSLKKTGIVLFLITLYMADHIERELHLGNVNLFLLIACFGILIFIQQKRTISAGITYGIILLFKPHFAILFPYFIWKKQWRVLMFSILSIGTGVLLPALFKGWNYNLLLHRQWL